MTSQPTPFSPETQAQIEAKAREIALDVQHRFPTASGETKKAVAVDELEAFVQQLYAATDLALDLPPLVDAAAALLIPYLSEAIEGAVQALKSLGLLGGTASAE